MPWGRPWRPAPGCYRAKFRQRRAEERVPAYRPCSANADLQGTPRRTLRTASKEHEGTADPPCMGTPQKVRQRRPEMEPMRRAARPQVLYPAPPRPSPAKKLFRPKHSGRSPLSSAPRFSSALSVFSGVSCFRSREKARPRRAPCSRRRCRRASPSGRTGLRGRGCPASRPRLPAPRRS